MPKDLLMENPQNTFTVFYSWQSDLAKERTSQLIRRALRVAATAVETARPGCRVVLDEATRGLPGSPNVPDSIRAKINIADMIVCDVTTITPKTNERPAPNPNVTFELGYAVATLGWSRVMILFNALLGNFPDDMPFDFDRHRASDFRASDPPTAGENKQLAGLLQTAMEAIIDANPSRPTRELTAEEQRHRRDADKLRWVLSTLHLPSLDEHVHESPHILKGKVLHFWESFNGVMENSLFHLYDAKLDTAFNRLHDAFRGTVSQSKFYRDIPHGNAYVFGMRGLLAQEEEDAAWRAIEASCVEMRSALDYILSRVRAEFLEVDIDATNRTAWKEYVAFEREMQKP
jgi:hypothetical protein